MNLNAPLESLIKAAGRHAADVADKDVAVLDLQSILRSAWSLLDVQQKRALLSSEAVAEVIKAGAHDAYNADMLIDTMAVTLMKMESALVNANYGIHKGAIQGTFYWEFDGFPSEDFTRSDMIVDAYQHLMKDRNIGKAKEFALAA